MFCWKIMSKMHGHHALIWTCMFTMPSYLNMHGDDDESWLLRRHDYISNCDWNNLLIDRQVATTTSGTWPGVARRNREAVPAAGGSTSASTSVQMLTCATISTTPRNHCRPRLRSSRRPRQVSDSVIVCSVC